MKEKCSKQSSHSKRLVSFSQKREEKKKEKEEEDEKAGLSK